MASWILRTLHRIIGWPRTPKKKSKPLGYAKSYGTRKSAAPSMRQRSGHGSASGGLGANLPYA